MQEIPLPATRRPSGIIVARDGTVWLSDTSGSALTVYDPAGASLHTLMLPTPQAGVFWFAPAPNNTLWAVEASLDANDPRDPGGNAGALSFLCPLRPAPPIACADSLPAWTLGRRRATVNETRNVCSGSSMSRRGR